jgi:hypothetical protein
MLSDPTLRIGIGEHHLQSVIGPLDLASTSLRRVRAPVGGLVALMVYGNRLNLMGVMCIMLG